tara:strand:+ start:165 stop:341 length:177 start_codon:yes stop_codon:yes gene_type:complete
MGVYNMSYDFNELFQATILEINNSNRLLCKEAEHQKQLQEAQEHTLEEETEELNFNDY